MYEYFDVRMLCERLFLASMRSKMDFLESRLLICLLGLQSISVECFAPFMVPLISTPKESGPNLNVNSKGFVNLGPANVTINVYGEKEAKFDQDNPFLTRGNSPGVFFKKIFSLFDERIGRPDDIFFSIDSRNTDFQSGAPIEFGTFGDLESGNPAMHVTLIEKKSDHGLGPMQEIYPPPDALSNLAKRVFSLITPLPKILKKSPTPDNKSKSADIFIDPPETENYGDKLKNHLLKKHGGAKVNIKVNSKISKVTMRSAKKNEIKASQDESNKKIEYYPLDAKKTFTEDNSILLSTNRPVKTVSITTEPTIKEFTTLAIVVKQTLENNNNDEQHALPKIAPQTTSDIGNDTPQIQNTNAEVKEHIDVAVPPIIIKDLKQVKDDHVVDMNLIVKNIDQMEGKTKENIEETPKAKFDTDEKLSSNVII